MEKPVRYKPMSQRRW